MGFLNRILGQRAAVPRPVVTGYPADGPRVPVASKKARDDIATFM
jgi:hypothetical protein